MCKCDRAVIWDIDGVLVDSEPLHFEALCEVSKQYGWEISEKNNQELLGLGLPDVYKELQAKFLSKAPYTEWTNEIVQYYVDKVSAKLIRPGIIETLELLKNSGVNMMAVSSAERVIVDANLNNTNLYEYFSGSISREDVTTTKPSAEPYLKALKKLNVSASAMCLAVEDSLFGLQSARAAGIETIAFPHGMSAPVPNDAADYLVSEITDFEWSSKLEIDECSNFSLKDIPA
jgi:HAD superfamily hydrolase (TIGR01509 family)